LGVSWQEEFHTKIPLKNHTKKYSASKTKPTCVHILLLFTVPSVVHARGTKHGETASIGGEVPTQEIIQHEDMANAFEFDEPKKSTGGGLALALCALAQSIRKYFWYRQKTAASP
jgi:hypothetical protein